MHVAAVFNVVGLYYVFAGFKIFTYCYYFVVRNKSYEKSVLEEFSIPFQIANINPQELVMGDRVATFMFYVSF